MNLKITFSFIVISLSIFTLSCSSSVHSPDRPLTKQERITLYKRLQLPGYSNAPKPLTQEQINQLPEKEQSAYLAKFQKEKEVRDRAIRHLNKWEKKALDLYYLSYSEGGPINYSNVYKNMSNAFQNKKSENNSKH